MGNGPSKHPLLIELITPFFLTHPRNTYNFFTTSRIPDRGTTREGAQHHAHAGYAQQCAMRWSRIKAAFHQISTSTLRSAPKVLTRTAPKMHVLEPSRFIHRFPSFAASDIFSSVEIACTGISTVASTLLERICGVCRNESLRWSIAGGLRVMHNIWVGGDVDSSTRTFPLL